MSKITKAQMGQMYRRYKEQYEAKLARGLIREDILDNGQILKAEMFSREIFESQIERHLIGTDSDQELTTKDRRDIYMAIVESQQKYTNAGIEAIIDAVETAIKNGDIDASDLSNFQWNSNGSFDRNWAMSNLDYLFERYGNNFRDYINT